MSQLLNFLPKQDGDTYFKDYTNNRTKRNSKSVYTSNIFDVKNESHVATMKLKQTSLLITGRVVVANE